MGLLPQVAQHYFATSPSASSSGDTTLARVGAIDVRCAREADGAALLAFYQAHWTGPLPTLAAWLAQGTMLVATQQGGVVGAVCAKVYDRRAGQASLQGLCVADPHNFALVTRLVGLVEVLSQAMGHRQVQLLNEQGQIDAQWLQAQGYCARHVPGEFLKRLG